MSLTKNKKRLTRGIVFLCATLLLGSVGVFAQQLTSRERAIEEGKKYAGTTIVVPWEAGLQAQAAYAMIPTWEKATGMKVEIVEWDYLALHDKQIAEHLAGTREYDTVTSSPVWMGNFVKGGLLEPLTRYIDKYMRKKDLEDILPIFREGLMKWEGEYYGLGDDGDVFILYYRKDLFEDPVNRMEFESEYGYELVPPKTWKEFQDIATFFTQKYAPKLYGAAIQRLPGQAYSWFVGPFVANGGEFFDLETMEPGVNKAPALKTLQQMVEQNKVMPPGVESWGFMESLSAWLAGRLAMTISWPPVGRWSEGYGTYTKQLDWVPETKVAGKVGYMPMPGGRSTLAGGFSLGINSQSRNKEAAYLFIQWWTSPEISLQVTMLPFGLRDPWRLSHFESPLYRNAWGNADEYLDTLKEAAMNGQWELGIPGGREYMEALDHAVTGAYGGEDLQRALDEATANWEKITNRLGKDSQREAYKQWLKILGASPK